MILYSAYLKIFYQFYVYTTAFIIIYHSAARKETQVRHN